MNQTNNTNAACNISGKKAIRNANRLVVTISMRAMIQKTAAATSVAWKMYFIALDNDDREKPIPIMLSTLNLGAIGFRTKQKKKQQHAETAPPPPPPPMYFTPTKYVLYRKPSLEQIETAIIRTKCDKVFSFCCHLLKAKPCIVAETTQVQRKQTLPGARKQQENGKNRFLLQY